MVHAGCVFIAGIHPSRTWMSGSFESVWWNACVNRLDLGLYSHQKEFGGTGVRTHVNSKGISPLPEAQRRVEPATLHRAGQRAQHTANWAVPVCVHMCNCMHVYGSILQLSEWICSWDTQACCWDVKQASKQPNAAHLTCPGPPIFRKTPEFWGDCDPKSSSLRPGNSKAVWKNHLL